MLSTESNAAGSSEDACDTLWWPSTNTALASGASTNATWCHCPSARSGGVICRLPTSSPSAHSNEGTPPVVVTKSAYAPLATPCSCSRCRLRPGREAYSGAVTSLTQYASVIPSKSVRSASSAAPSLGTAYDGEAAESASAMSAKTSTPTVTSMEYASPSNAAKTNLSYGCP